MAIWFDFNGYGQSVMKSYANCNSVKMKKKNNEKSIVVQSLSKKIVC